MKKEERKTNFKKRETFDLAVFLVYPIIASLISFLLRANAFFSVIIFYGIPSIYLSFMMKKNVKNAAVFSLVGIIPMIVIDYIAHLTKVWEVTNSIIPFRLFGFVTLEVLLWVIFAFYFTVMFYEYFLDKHITHKLYKPRFKYLIISILALFSLFLFLLFGFPQFLRIPYFYLIFGVILILIPIVFELFEYPRFYTKFFKAQAYFFYLNFIYEITALKLGWWIFPGNEFVGWVSVFGVEFPFEEFFFWIMLTALAILTYFEFFDREIRLTTKS